MAHHCEYGGYCLECVIEEERELREEEALYGSFDENEDYLDDREIGTCQGCGGYGEFGRMCVRNGEECGEFI